MASINASDTDVSPSPVSSARDPYAPSSIATPSINHTDTDTTDDLPYDDLPPPPRIFSSEDPGRFALTTLTLINLLNYIDRYVPSATKEYFQPDLGLSDAESSAPLTAFVIVYMLASPVFSYLSDRGYARNKLIASGVVVWSAATAAGALAVDFWTLLLSRSLVGVGEAAYATIAPALLADFYTPQQRNNVLSIFYLGIPIGSAMGYALGGEVGEYLGWRYAFLIAGLPGVVVAAMCMAIKEPRVGAMDDKTEAETEEPEEEEEEEEEESVKSETEQPIRRRGSHPDLRFGLTPEESANESVEDAGGAFAVDTEIGGPALTHPHPRRQHSHALARSRSAAPIRHHAAHAEYERLSAGAGAASPMPSASDPTHQMETETETERDGSGHLRARSIIVRSASSTGIDVQQPSDGMESASFSQRIPPWKESVILLIRNPAYMYSTIGVTFVTFASGGLADWMPTWLHRVHDMDKDTAATMVGALTCVAGIIGTAFGSFMAERAKGRIRQPYLGVPGLLMIVTVLGGWMIMVMNNIYAIAVIVFIAEVCMWAYTGPINALTLNCVSSTMRVRAFAFQILISHAFGDAIAPTIVGALSDATHSIRSAILIVPAAFTAAMITWLLGWRRAAELSEIRSRTGSMSHATSRIHTAQHSRNPTFTAGQLRTSASASIPHPYDGMKSDSLSAPLLDDLGASLKAPSDTYLHPIHLRTLTPPADQLRGGVL